jgi:glycosyltransferase involved in cell wall biosynthesis
MKIAVWHNLPSGGAKRALYDHVRGLLAHGHEVESWTPPTADTQFLPLGEIIPEHQLPLGPFQVSGLMRRFAAWAGLETEAIGRMHAMEEHARHFADALRDRDFDVVLAAACRWFHVPAIAHKLRIPATLYLQEPFRPLYEPMPRLPWIAEDDVAADPHSLRDLRRVLGSGARAHAIRIQAREEMHNARAFDQILVNSRFSRESVLRAYGLDSIVCYLGIDTARFENHAGPREPVALSVGQLSLHKNPEFVIRAVAMSRTKPVLRWIANDVSPGYPEHVHGLASQLGVTLDLRVNVSDEELIRHYQQSSVLLYAPRLEPFGYAPLEANACGMPAVGIAEGGLRETIVDGTNGILVDDIHGMAVALDSLLQNPEYARQLGQSGAGIVRRTWTTEAATGRLEEHLRTLIAQNSRSGSSTRCAR